MRAPRLEHTDRGPAGKRQGLTVPEALGEQSFCYVTTTGRVTGNPHQIEIWFALVKDRIYLLAGGGRRSDWVKNVEADPKVTIRIGPHHFEGTATIVTDGDEDRMVRPLLAAKYQGWREGTEMSGWARNALPVRIDLIPRR